MFATGRFAPENIWLARIRLRKVEVSQLRPSAAASRVIFILFSQSCFSRGVDGLAQNHSHAGLAAQPTRSVRGSWLGRGQACMTAANDADTALGLRRHS